MGNIFIPNTYLALNGKEIKILLTQPGWIPWIYRITSDFKKNKYFSWHPEGFCVLVNVAIKSSWIEYEEIKGLIINEVVLYLVN